MLSLFSPDTPPPNGVTRSWSTHNAGSKAYSDACRCEIAWNRLLHSGILIREPLLSHNVRPSLAGLILRVFQGRP